VGKTTACSLLLCSSRPVFAQRQQEQKDAAYAGLLQPRPARVGLMTTRESVPFSTLLQNHCVLLELRSFVGGEVWEGGAHVEGEAPLPEPGPLGRLARQPGLWTPSDEQSARCAAPRQLC